ncbi:BGTF surface domain-containing protein [Halopenitus sp. H-Gu1]|uniref:BGTF surface domain-containing protein n=1 Tax=Halopenitus sp. H-Gu1 TaxID=3242697 RepID=UPI00359CDB02
MTRDTPIQTTARAVLLAVLCSAAVCLLAVAPAAATADAVDQGPETSSASIDDVDAPAPSRTATSVNGSANGPANDPANSPTNGSDTRIDDGNGTGDGAGASRQVGGWSTATYERPAGDVVTVTLDLSSAVAADDADGETTDVPDHAYVQIGSAEAGFIDVLRLEDVDGDGEVTVSINTRTLGTSDSVSATNTDLVYYSEDDAVRSGVHGRFPTGEDGATFVGPEGESLEDFDAYLAELGLIASADTDRGIDQLDRPLQPGEYPIAAGTTGEFRVVEAGSTAPQESTPGKSAMVADDEAAPLGRAMIALEQPGIEGVSIQAAPAGAANAADNRTVLQESMGQRDVVAAGDRLVIATEATGIYGHLVAIEGDFESLETGFAPGTLAELETRTGEGVRFAVEAKSGPVIQGPGSSGSIDSPLEVLDLTEMDPEAVSVYADNEVGELYVVVDTRAVRVFDPDDEDEELDFSASMAYDTDPEEPFLFDRADRHIETFYRGLLGGAGGDPGEPAFPYLEPGDDESETANFSVAEPWAHFEGIEDKDADGEDAAVGTIRLTNAESVRIAGETNLAPGTKATLRVVSAEAASLSYVQLATVEVESDGTFSATFDLSEASAGDMIEVRFSVNEEPVATANAEIVGPDVRTPPEPTAPDVPSLTGETPDLTEESTPGFGVVAALLALVAAIGAAVGVRRRV